MFQIDVSSNGEFVLYLPDSRTVEIQASAQGVAFIKKIILDYQRGVRNQAGYIGRLPTQHAVDKAFADQFLKEKAIAAAKAKAEGLKQKLNIDWEKLEINL